MTTNRCSTDINRSHPQRPRMSRYSHCSRLFHGLWNTLWNALTSNDAGRWNSLSRESRQSAVPKTTFPQVTAFHQTHPLKGEAPNGTAASPGADPHCGWHDEHEPHIEGFGRCDGSALAVEHSDDPPRVVDVERACRSCGCTDVDCSSCVERTGQACWWVEADLCSACVASMSVSS